MVCNPYIKLEVRGCVTRDEKFFLDTIDTNAMEQVVMDVLGEVFEKRQRATLTFIRMCDGCGDEYQLHMFEADSKDLEKALAYINSLASGSTPQMKRDLFIVEVSDGIMSDVFDNLHLYEALGSLLTNMIGFIKPKPSDARMHVRRINLRWHGHQN